MAAALVILGCALSLCIPACVSRLHGAMYAKTIHEMTSIAQASIDFYNSAYPHIWPSSTAQLSQGYLFDAVAQNPWGNSYDVSFQNGLVTVLTTIPSGIAQAGQQQGAFLTVVQGSRSDQISVSESVPNHAVGWVQYEKKYLYHS